MPCVSFASTESEFLHCYRSFQSLDKWSWLVIEETSLPPFWLIQRLTLECKSLDSMFNLYGCLVTCFVTRMEAASWTIRWNQDEPIKSVDVNVAGKSLLLQHRSCPKGPHCLLCYKPSVNSKTSTQLQRALQTCCVGPTRWTPFKCALRRLRRPPITTPSASLRWLKHPLKVGFGGDARKSEWRTCLH